MKLRDLKIGQVIITPKMLLSLIGSFFIQGMGIGAAATLPNNSLFPLLTCTIISLIIIVYTFSRKQKTEFITQSELKEFTE